MDGRCRPARQRPAAAQPERAAGRRCTWRRCWPRCGSWYDTVLVDTPPLLPVTDAAAVAPAADGVLLVTRFRKTTREQVAAAVAAISVGLGAAAGHGAEHGAPPRPARLRPLPHLLRVPPVPGAGARLDAAADGAAPGRALLRALAQQRREHRGPRQARALARQRGATFAEPAERPRDRPAAGQATSAVGHRHPVGVTGPGQRELPTARCGQVDQRRAGPVGDLAGDGGNGAPSAAVIVNGPSGCGSRVTQRILLPRSGAAGALNGWPNSTPRIVPRSPTTKGTAWSGGENPLRAHPGSGAGATSAAHPAAVGAAGPGTAEGPAAGVVDGGAGAEHAAAAAAATRAPSSRAPPRPPPRRSRRYAAPHNGTPSAELGGPCDWGWAGGVLPPGGWGSRPAPRDGTIAGRRRGARVGHA